MISSILPARVSILLHLCLLLTHFAFKGNAFPTIPSWNEIESKLNPSLTHKQPLTIDSSLHPNDRPDYSTDKPTLFRERHSWCPYSERVFLALEVMNVPYETIYIDNTGHGRRPSYFTGQTPQMKWEDGSTQGESMDLVRQINTKYKDAITNTNNIDLYPMDIQSDVLNKIQSFTNIFPKRTRPSSRAAFLFRYDGEPLWKNEFEKVLRETNDLLGESTSSSGGINRGGPFFCGERFTAADIAWAPFLERYAAQLPCLHDGLNPRCDVDRYPHLVAWYDAMDDCIPEYRCKVKGDASSWRKVLTMAGFGNAGVPLDVSQRMEDVKVEESKALTEEEVEKEQRIWDLYSSTRPWVASSASAEAASVMVRNRKAIVKDIGKRAAPDYPLIAECTDNELDLALRSMVWLLYQNESDNIMINVETVASLATYLDERMCVPRDMGCLSAAAIKRLIPTLKLQI